MKKIALFLSLVLLATATYAAVPAAKKATASSNAPIMGLVGVTLTSIGCPAVNLGMGGWSLDVGGQIVNAANTTTITLIGRGILPINRINDTLLTYWGPGVMYNSAGSGTVNISVFLGAEYLFASNLSIFADLTAFSLTSAAGTTNWFAGANAGQIYTGGRLYF